MPSTDQPATVRFESPNPAYSFDMPAAAHAALHAMLTKRAAERQAVAADADTRDEVLYPEWMERDADLPERSGWLQTGWLVR